MAEARELKVLRAVLEEELDPTNGAAVLFVGLDRTEAFPVEPADWHAFVHGGLKDALEERVGAEEAAPILAKADSHLREGTKPPPRAERSSEAPTRELQKLDGPSKVLVVAASSRLSRTLQGAMGSRVVPMAVGDATRVRAFIDDFEPGVVVVDITDPIAGLGPALADGLADDALVVVWGTGDRALKLTEAFRADGTRATRLDGREGVPPLLDLVRGAAV